MWTLKMPLTITHFDKTYIREANTDNSHICIECLERKCKQLDKGQVLCNYGQITKSDRNKAYEIFKEHNGDITNRKISELLSTSEKL